MAGSYLTEKDDDDHTNAVSSSDDFSKDVKDASDVESQYPPLPLVEREASFRRKMAFLAVYFLLNLGLTLSNKALLGKVRRSAVDSGSFH